MMQDASSPLPVLSSAYQPLPWLYLGFLAIWAASGFCWASSSWRSRHFQTDYGFILNDWSLNRDLRAMILPPKFY
uniref:Uncharacterized protein n=1 Tax=Oryza rufipogon TaxID=4529 RepID=A0A0E0R880_ORYRU